jgi:hypothetical protein
MVTLCPYVVGGLAAPTGLERLSRLGAGHDGVLVPGEQGLACSSRPEKSDDLFSRSEAFGAIRGTTTDF